MAAAAAMGNRVHMYIPIKEIEKLRRELRGITHKTLDVEAGSVRLTGWRLHYAPPSPLTISLL